MGAMVRLALGYMLVTIVGCAQSPPMDYLPELHARRPASILIIPVVNRSVDVEAPLAVLSTLPRMLAEKGYYVFPVNTVKTLLEFEGLYEADEVRAMPAAELADLFGAESILYVTIHEWTTQYVLVDAKTIVDLEYALVAGDGTRLWSARKQMTHRPDTQANSSSVAANLLVAAIGAALERLDPEFIPLAREANSQAFNHGKAPIPPGPYSPAYNDYYMALFPPAQPATD